MRTSNLSNNYSASMMSESDDDDFSVPEERDWKGEIKTLNKKTGDFNIKNYIHILSEEEKTNYLKIIDKIPEANRVYMQ